MIVSSMEHTMPLCMAVIELSHRDYSLRSPMFQAKRVTCSVILLSCCDSPLPWILTELHGQPTILVEVAQLHKVSPIEHMVKPPSWN
jgi:hypothetical protein